MREELDGLECFFFFFSFSSLFFFFSSPPPIFMELVFASFFSLVASCVDSEMELWMWVEVL